jgi:hypothetical protein
MLVIVRVLVKDQGRFPAAPGTERVFLDLDFPRGNVPGIPPPSVHLGVLRSNGSVQVWHGLTSSDA